MTVESKPHSSYFEIVHAAFDRLGWNKTPVNALEEQYEGALKAAYDAEEVGDELRRELQGLKEQFEALRNAALRVMDADNMSLIAPGAEGLRAMREMEDALENLGAVVNSNPASRQDESRPEGRPS